MSQYTSKKFEDLEITRDELNTIKDAFKKDDFRKLFSDYVKEMNDPATRAVYEKEMTQLEKERGVDITFVHPTPSYVIKTSVDGTCKAFINICSNDIVGQPKAEQAQENNSQGTNWSLPYLQAPPREDMDKSCNRCVIYDVLFHPDTLKLASCKPSFKKFVNDTAISAVEDSFKVTLDKRNIKYPKLKYKGREEVTVIRKKSSTPSEVNKEDLFEIPNYVEVTDEPKPKVVKHQSVIIEPDSFTTPKYEIKQRKAIEMHEFTEGIDSKMYAATPSELVVIIDLPLLKSASDVKLDVYEKALSLVSEKPSRYMLDIELPWIVDEESGNAKFDKSTKKLHVTLPVRKRKYQMSDFVREDSGIESDRSQSVKSSSEEDISESVVELPGSLDSEHYRTKEQTQSQPAPTTFLNPEFHYSFPPFTINLLKQTLAIIIHVPNIDQSSINRIFLENNSGVQVRLTSMGPGFFPIHYAFCINLPDGVFDPSSTSIETCDNNAVIRVTFSKCPSSPEYYTGLTPDDLSKNLFGEPINIANSIKEEKPKEECPRDILSVEKERDSMTVILSKLNLNEKESSKSKKSMEPAEETECDGLNDKDEEEDSMPKVEGAEGDDEDNLEENFGAPTKAALPKPKLRKQFPPKTRTLSECGQITLEQGRRSILKTSRSLSESNVDDYSVWSSVDSSDSCIPEENCNGSKKTVRFSDIITEKVFRANSSILGQKKKNQRKSRNKKKAHDRRASESEASGSEIEASELTSDLSASEVSASDVSDVSDTSSEVDENVPKLEVIPSSKTHRRRGHKNKRKNASTAKHNSTMLNMDD